MRLLTERQVWNHDLLYWPHCQVPVQH
jgi:hypothetical protein